jgi:hypothetical protein
LFLLLLLLHFSFCPLLHYDRDPLGFSYSIIAYRRSSSFFPWNLFPYFSNLVKKQFEISFPSFSNLVKKQLVCWLGRYVHFLNFRNSNLETGHFFFINISHQYWKYFFLNYET